MNKVKVAIGVALIVMGLAVWKGKAKVPTGTLWVVLGLMVLVPGLREKVADEIEDQL